MNPDLPPPPHRHTPTREGEKKEKEDELPGAFSFLPRRLRAREKTMDSSEASTSESAAAAAAATATTTTAPSAERDARRAEHMAKFEEKRRAIMACKITLRSVVPAANKPTLYTRQARDTASGHPETVLAKRFSLFIDKPDVLPLVNWTELLQTDGTGLRHTPEVLIVDDDTMCVFASLEIVSINADIAEGVPTISTCKGAVLACHHCKNVVAVVTDKDPDPEQSQKTVLVCRGCGFAKYCNEWCAKRAWGLGHKLVCGQIRKRMYPASVLAIRH